MITYLAVPYSHASADIREARYHAVTVVAGELMKAGKIIYSPITHGHPIADAVDMPTNWQFWQKHCMAILQECSELLVLKLAGWDSSVGVAAEMDEARRLRIPVGMLEPGAFKLEKALLRELRKAHLPGGMV